MRDLILKYFPFLNEYHFLKELEHNARLAEFEEGEVIMKYGRSLTHIYLVYEGSVSVSRYNEEGDKVFLYYLNPGDMCAVSFVCASQGRVSQVKAVAMEKSKAIALPVNKVQSWTADHKCWHRYTLDTMRDRLDELLKVIDSIAFKKLDDRILEYLEKTCHSNSQHRLNITHSDIATALHTSREVVSRLLKRLEKDGKVQLNRNNVKLMCHVGYEPGFCTLHCDKNQRTA